MVPTRGAGAGGGTDTVVYTEQGSRRVYQARVVHLCTHPGYTTITAHLRTDWCTAAARRGVQEEQPGLRGPAGAWVHYPGYTTLPRVVTVLREESLREAQDAQVKNGR